MTSFIAVREPCLSAQKHFYFKNISVLNFVLFAQAPDEGN